MENVDIVSATISVFTFRMLVPKKYPDTFH